MRYSEKGTIKTSEVFMTSEVWFIIPRTRRVIRCPDRHGRFHFSSTTDSLAAEEIASQTAQRIGIG